MQKLCCFFTVLAESTRLIQQLIANIAHFLDRNF